MCSRKQYFSDRISEEWRDDKGGYHREDGPAFIERDRKTNKVVRALYWVHDKLHRVDGPAEFEIDPETDVVTQEYYFHNSVRHRVDGPAYIERNPQTGAVVREEWFFNGQLHREGGPAVTHKLKSVTLEYYFVNGIQVDVLPE